jgi:hypothetical protein
MFEFGGSNRPVLRLHDMAVTRAAHCCFPFISMPALSTSSCPRGRIGAESCGSSWLDFPAFSRSQVYCLVGSFAWRIPRRYLRATDSRRRRSCGSTPRLHHALSRDFLEDPPLRLSIIKAALCPPRGISIPSCVGRAWLQYLAPILHIGGHCSHM